MSGRELPAGWVEAELGDIADIKSGITLGKKRSPDQELIERPYLRVANVQRGSLDLSTIKTIAVTPEEAEALKLEEGDILMNEGGDRDKLGRGWVWTGEIPNCIHQNHVFRVRLRDRRVQSKYVSLYANEIGRHFFERQGKQSVNLASINQTMVAKLPIPIPPFPEQRRIVEKIEALTARSRRAREALDALPALIDRYRQSILAAAFRGDLSSDKSCKRRSMSVGELVAEPTCNGISIRGTDTPPGVPALKLNALTDQGIDFWARRYIPLDENKAKRIYVCEDDFFVSRGNGSLDFVGRGALASNPPEPIVFPDTMIRIRLDRKIVLPKWFALIWGAPQVREQIRERVKTTAGIWKISQFDLASISVDVPSIDVQTGEIQRIQQGLKAIEMCRVQFHTAAARLSTLDQSILAKAFRGELVPQDPNDEPASVLLERIRAERAAAGEKPRRGRPRKAG